MWPGLSRLTEWFERQRREDDLLVVRPTKRSDETADGYGYVLVDWAPTRLEGAVAVMNMFYCHYLRECAYLAELLGRDREGQRLCEQAERSRAAIRRLLFDDTRGIFVNCRDATGPSRQAGTQENLLALLWDLATPEQARRILDALLPDDQPLPIWTTENRNWLTLSTGTEPWDEDRIVPVGSPFFMYYALAALFEIGRTTAALANVRAHYGELLARGETTLWEDFSGDTSRSHGWGAGPTAFAGRYLLGVEPMQPGFDTFGVLPSFGDLHAASGRVPTPHGVVSVSWQLERGDGASPRGGRMVVTVPEGTRALAGVPAASAGDRLLRNGSPCGTERRVLRRGVYTACVLQPGRHELRWGD